MYRVNPLDASWLLTTSLVMIVVIVVVSCSGVLVLMRREMTTLQEAGNTFVEVVRVTIEVRVI